MTNEERKALVDDLSHELAEFMNPFGMSANTAALCLLPIIEKLREADGQRIAELEAALGLIADLTEKRQLPLTLMVNDIARAALGEK